MSIKKEIEAAHYQAFRDLLTGIGEEIALLSKEDFGTVAQNVASLISKRVSEKPYETLASAAGLGFVLGGLRATQLKRAAIVIGKLVAVRTMSRIDDQAGNQPDQKVMP